MYWPSGLSAALFFEASGCLARLPSEIARCVAAARQEGDAKHSLQESLRLEFKGRAVEPALDSIAFSAQGVVCPFGDEEAFLSCHAAALGIAAKLRALIAAEHLADLAVPDTNEPPPAFLVELRHFADPKPAWFEDGWTRTLAGLLKFPEFDHAAIQAGVEKEAAKVLLMLPKLAGETGGERLWTRAEFARLLGISEDALRKKLNREGVKLSAAKEHAGRTASQYRYGESRQAILAKLPHLTTDFPASELVARHQLAEAEKRAPRLAK